MENTFITSKSVRSSVFVRAIAASLVALMGITGLATPASANITPTLQSADVTESGGVSSLALITGVDRVVTISSTGESQSEITLRSSISATVSSATAIASGSTTLTTAAAHGFAVGDTVTIAGLTPATLNGVRVVSEISSATTFAFAAPEGVTGEVTVSSATAKRNDVTVTSSDATVVAVPAAGTTAAGKIPFTFRGLKAGSTVLTFTSPGRQPLAVNVTVTTPALKADVSTILVPVSDTPEIVTISSSDTTLVDRAIVKAVSTNTGLVVNAVEPISSVAISSASTIDAGSTTVTTAAAHGLAVGNRVEISGLTPATLNGVRVVTVVGSTTTFSFAVSQGETGDVTVESAQATAVEQSFVSGGKAAFAVSLAEGATAATVAGATITFTTSNYTSLTLGIKPDKLKSNDIIENEKSPGSFSLGLTTNVDRVVTIASFRGDTLRSSVSATVSSAADIADGATTLTTAAAHALAVGDVVTIAGLTPATLNGVKVVTAVPSTTTFTFAVTEGETGAVTVASATAKRNDVTVTSSNTSVIVAPAPSSAAAGKIPFTFRGLVAGTTVLTFSSPGRADLVVNATVTNPQLISDVAGLVVTNTDQSVTISSNELRFTDANPITSTLGTLVTAVSSDPTALEVKPALTSPVVAISSATISAGSTTITTAAAHGFVVGSNVTISGLTPATLNGVRVVTVVGSTTTFSFAVPGTESGDVTVASATAQRTGHAADGAVVFTVKMKAGVDAADVQGETITFSSSKYKDVVITVAPDKLESDLASSSVALLTGRESETFEISSDVNAITDAEDLTFASSSSDVTVEAGELVAGKVSFTIKGELAGSAVLTFSAPGRLDYVVNVTVTDPKLKSDVAELLLTETNQNIVINSTELGLPVGTEVTAVASDSNIFTVVPSSPDADGNAVVAANGSVTFAAKIASGKTAADFEGVETITFTSANYQDVVVTVAPDKLESDLTSSSVALLTGKSTTFNVNSDLNPLTSNATFSSNGEVTVTVGTLTDGKTPVTVTGDLAGDAQITFSAPGRLNYVVNVTVTDPKLKAAKGATAITDLLLTTTNQTITISSTELALPEGTDVTAVASDDSLITVVPSTPDTNGDALAAANGTVSFEIKAVRGFDSDESITFVSSNYEQFVLDVTTPKLASANVIESEIAPGVYSYKVGLKGTGALSVSSPLEVLTANATVVSSNANVSAVAGTLTDGKTPFTITGNAAGSAVLTFSAPGRADLVVNVTVAAPYLSAATTETVAIGQSKSITINSSGTADAAVASQVKVTATSADATVVSVTRSGISDNTFVVTGMEQSEEPVELTFARPGFVSVVVEVEVTKAALSSVSDVASYDIYVSQSVSFDLTSDTFPLASDIVLEATASEEGVVETTFDGNEVTIKAIEAGSASVTIVDSNGHYTPVVIEVATQIASLSTDAVTYEILYGQSAEITVSSDEVPFTVGGVRPVIENGDEESVTISATPTLANGALVYTVSGIAAGTSELIFTRAGLTPVTATVIVNKPAVSADADLSAIFVGDTAVVTLTSDEQPISAADLATFEAVASDPEVLDVGSVEIDPLVPNTATITVTGLKAGASSIEITSTNYEAAVAQMTVTMPALKTEAVNVRAFVGVPTVVEVSSDERALVDAVDASTTSGLAIGASGDCTDATQTGTGDTIDGISSVTLCGVNKGTYVLTVSAENYSSITIRVTVINPALVSDVTKPSVFVTETGEIEISTEEMELTEAHKITATSSTPGAITFESIPVAASATKALSEESVTVSSATAIAVGKTTLTTGAAHGFVVGDSVTVTGLTPASLNGVRVVTEVPSTTSFTFAVPGTETGSVTVATGDEDPTFVNTVEVAGAEGVAKFRYQANLSGVHKIVFSGAGFQSVTVIVTVTKPALVAESTSVVVNNGGVVTFSVGSNEVDLADTTLVEADVANVELGETEVAESAAGEAVVSFTALTVGVSTITVSSANYKPVTVRVTVLPARLELDVTEVDTSIYATSQILVTSPDKSEFDPTDLVPTVLKDTVASVTLLEDDSSAGNAVFEVKGLAKGTTTVSFAAPGFVTAKAAIKVAVTRLSASSSSVQIFGGQAGSITISSPDLEITEDIALEAGLLAEATGSAITIGNDEYAEGIEYADGAAIIHFVGAEKGRAKLSVTGTGFTKTSTSVNVVQPGLVSNVSTLAFRADKSATFKISSNDLELADGTELAFEGDALVAEFELVEGVATVTLTGAEILEKATINLAVSATTAAGATYKTKTIKVTVTPAPVCVAKSLGSIKFSDTDAKLTSASTANIKKFAAELVNNNCSAAKLTSYVPIANTKANAAKYAKELQLAASRESAVRSVLTAEVTKLKGTVTVTVVKGSVPANVLTGSTAAQSAYRKIDVAADVLEATTFRLRNLI